MALVHYRPLFDLDADMRTLQKEMNRLFGSASTAESYGFVPVAELSEMDDVLQLKFELPGMNKEDINVEVMQGSVKISGERKVKSEKEGNGNRRTEFRYGRFERIISLPAEVKNTEAKAEYKDGILVLTLPKRISEAEKVHKVEL